jgi:hypothetical protein
LIDEKHQFPNLKVGRGESRPDVIGSNVVVLQDQYGLGNPNPMMHLARFLIWEIYSVFVCGQLRKCLLTFESIGVLIYIHLSW